MVNQLSVRFHPGICVVQAVDIRQDDKPLGTYQLCHNGGKRVIVSKILSLQLAGFHSVVFVDYRNHAQLQQLCKGVLYIYSAAFPVHHVRSQKNLSHHVVVFSKKFVVQEHQLALSHGGKRLFLFRLFGPLKKPQLSHADADGPGGDQHQLLSRVLQIRQGSAKLLQPVQVYLAVVISEGGSAHLHHQNFRVFELHQIHSLLIQIPAALETPLPTHCGKHLESMPVSLNGSPAHHGVALVKNQGLPLGDGPLGLVKGHSQLVGSCLQHCGGLFRMTVAHLCLDP